MAPGLRANVSQMLGPRPSVWVAPSIWYAAVAVPQVKSAGKALRSVIRHLRRCRSAPRRRRPSAVAGPAGRLRASVPLQSVTRSLARSRVNIDPRARGLGQGVLDIVRTACGLQRLRGEGEESEDQGAEALGVARQAVHKKHAQRLIAAGVDLRRR